MFILNQTDTGKPCPRRVAHLHREIPEGSLMCFVKVHAFDLAMVLDRLTALEDFQAKALQQTSQMRNHISIKS